MMRDCERWWCVSQSLNRMYHGASVNRANSARAWGDRPTFLISLTVTIICLPIDGGVHFGIIICRNWNDPLHLCHDLQNQSDLNLDQPVSGSCFNWRSGCVRWYQLPRGACCAWGERHDNWAVGLLRQKPNWSHNCEANGCLMPPGFGFRLQFADQHWTYTSMSAPQSGSLNGTCLDMITSIAIAMCPVSDFTLRRSGISHCNKTHFVQVYNASHVIGNQIRLTTKRNMATVSWVKFIANSSRKDRWT